MSYNRQQFLGHLIKAKVKVEVKLSHKMRHGGTDQLAH